MSQDNKPAGPDEQQRQVEPTETGQDEGSVCTRLAEARIWAAANKLARDGEEPSGKKQKST